MLKNNSFERGFEGWEYVGWTLLEAQNPKSGKYIIQAGKLASGGDSGCNQTVELQAGKTYRIGAWVRKSADFAINNAGNNKISLRNADLTPLKDIPITGAGLSTNWALISGEYTPAKTASVVVSLRASVASGYMYLDDVFCVDVSNEKAIDATSNALSTLNSTVTQQGKDITSNSNSITSLSNQMVNGRQNMWVRSVYNVQLANNTTEPTFSDINGKAPISIDEVPDAAKLDFASAGSYVIAHYKAFVKVNADTTITMAPGSRVFDDTGAVYVNGVRVAFGNASWNTVSFDLKAGWSTVEFLVNQWTGQAYINLGFKLSEKVAQLNSALGMNALSNAISAVTSNVSTVGDRVTSTSQSVTDLRNSLEQTNANLANKADAQALSTLQNTVSKQGDTISSQGNSITNLNNTLTAARNAGDNLIPNYDFLQGATAWDTQYPAGVTFGNFGDGKAGVKLNRTTTTSPGIFSNNNKPLPLNGQRKYRVVVKAKGVSGAMNMLIRRQNKIGQTDSNYEDKNVTLTSEWQTITWETGLTASNADGQNFKLYAHPANAEIWVDTFKVFDITDEVKIKANSDALSTLSSTVTQQGDKITSQGNSITKLTNDLEAADANIAKKADQSAVTTLTGRVEKTESGLTAANSNITSLSSSLNQQSKRGANLLPDGTFESYAVGHNLSNNRVIVTTDDSHGGNKCIRVTRPNDYNANATDSSDNHIFSGFQVRDNAVFYMECWVKLDAKSTAMAENAQISIGLSLQYQDNSWQWPAVTKAAKDLSTAQWTKVSGYLKSTKSGIKQAMVRISIPNVSSVKAGNSFLIDDLVITEVTDAYNAQSTADANANAISTLDSTVSQQGDQITSQGNSITKLTNDLSTTNNNVSKKADANALTALTNRVTQTEKDINSTSSSVTNLNNKVDAISVGGTNLIKNSGDMTGWSNVVSDTYRGNAVISATVKAGSGYRDLREITLESPVDAGEYVYSFYAKGGVAGQTMTAFFYNPNTTTSIETSQGAKGNNTDGRAQFTLTTSWARYWVKWKQTPTTGTKRLILCRIESNTSKDQTVYINSPKFEVGNVVSDWNESPSDSASASAVDSLTTKVNQQGTSISSIGNRTTSLENGLSTAQNNIAKKADASALQDLRNTVTSQGGDLTAANSSITSLQASMNRRTVFTVTARGNGNSVTHGVFDESGKNLFTPGRSWALVTFAKHSDGSTVIATSKTYDVFGSANNGATMSADIEALASGTYVCVLTFDEPTGNRGKVLSALESLGGTSEVVNSLPYRGAYILLGRKGMKPGDGLELRAPTGGDATAHISTSVEFVNGVMMGLGAAGGVMMKADANASAITTLQNTVKTQGDNIDSLSSSTTALENSLASSNASVDAASQIPGNLIVNPSFERGTEGYTGWSGIATVVTLQVPHLGTKAAKLAAGGSAGVGQKISFKKDRSYKIGIWAKQDPNTTIQSTDNTKFRVAEGNGLIASKAYGPFTSNWQEVSWTWKATKDVVADVQFTAFLSAGAMYFDDFYVVDVTDSVETQANSSAITKLDSRVTKTENDITSQGSQVTQLKNDLATTNTNVSKKADAAALTALTNRVTQNEKEIETQSSQTTSLKNSLSTVQAMGSNPWFDGSLETYSENQQISGSRAVVVSSQRRSGTKSLRVSRGAGEGGNSDKSIGKWIALRENAVFRIELWAMMPADQSPSSGWSTIVGLQTQNAANNNNWPSAITITEGSLGGRGTWKKFTGTLRVATGHTRGVFWISTRGSTGAGTPGYDLYIDDVVVTDITDAKEAQDSANANASALTSLTSRVTNVEGQVTSQASQLSSLTSQVNDASSKVDQMAQTITNNEKTQSSLNTSLQSQIDAQASANIKNQTELNNATTSLAAIKSTQQTQATTISALSQQQTNLTAQVGGQSAELQELKKTVVENGNVNSTWMVKMETNSNGKKYAAGIALGIDGKNLQSQFLVQADRFGLINTSNGNTTTPFVIENGVAYINAAVIKDGSITNAKIGGEIRSDNFVNGSNGWRIGKDGSSQFNNVVIRGEVHANTGVLNNVTINENCTVLGTVQANKIVGDVVTMTDRVVKNWPPTADTSSGTRYPIASVQGMPFERRMVFNGSISIQQTWRQNVTIRVDETVVWTFDSGNDGRDFETSIFSIRIPASNYGQTQNITIQWPNRGDSGQFRFTGVISMYRTTGSISLA
ncbi:phage tail tip fiber protein [Klebsiella pneumoniae]